jgi:drug/metabolite transporter (DMT)-like permease
MTRGVRHVPALETALLLLHEPVLSAVWSWLAHGEQPGVFALVGGAVILASTIGSAVGRRGSAG